ncbi:putative ABC transport system permease protein [Novosphingobium kunmingense]|uniref:Putative ABC transport system permease protein n=1 Tax=Novosphingobium kunmingense TaxID=1211806 RepID=A0A2N0HJC9_9SPHN|nr:FtsX-like permease family protein [Novosphingobium kunmingense]PKB19039.1 putative ABC transport system permease protein [Novosphingobium kunmingense]
MRSLDLKLVRDLWHLRGQAIAIALVLAAATATFVMSLGVHRSLAETRDAYYARNHFGDIFVGMTRAPRSVVDRIAAIPGVRRAEGGIQQYATLNFPRRVVPVRALLNAVEPDGPNHLNQVTLRQGRLPRASDPGEVVADEAFAKANGLAVGSQIEALIYGRKQNLRIVGIGLAPNFIYALAPGDIIPDDERFGVFWIGRKALEAATDRTEAINSLSLTLERGASGSDVIHALDSILAPFGGSGAYGRKDHLSHAFLDNELMQLSAMTRVIPPVFLLVAVFLVYIVLGRMIRTERTQIGLIKAFGYSDWAIGRHYLKFALAIALLATVMGTAAGIWMGDAMTRLYAQYYRFPFLYYRISLSVIVAAAALSFAAAALGAIGGVRSAVRLTPAVAMSPPPPPAYRAGTVERLGKAAGFSAIGHMIVRHIARWPGRAVITVSGVALSGGLLFATTQFIDSSRTMIDSFFFRAQRQDLTVTFTEPRNASALYALAQVPGVLRVEPTRAVSVKLSNGKRIERTAIESLPANSQLGLRIDRHGNAVALPASGLMLSSQLASKLAVRIGDRVDVEMLGGRRTQRSLPVASIVDEFVGARAYSSEQTLESITRDASPVGAALVRIDPSARDSILTRLRDAPMILGVTEKAAALVKFRAMIDDNMLTMIAFYVAFASAIAVGVVYNSARILFSERAHELATLRVLGYFRSEVGLVLLGELGLLVAASLPIGCFVGYGMGQLMTAMFSSDLFRLPFAPSRASYGWSSVIVLIAAMTTALTVARRVQKLDMVRVLKGRE